MNRNKVCTRALIGVLVVMMVPCGAFAQDAGTKGTFSKQEMDQMLAPVALYPDSLLAQVLIAATYPDQVAEANDWVKQNKGLSGDQLNDALDQKNWDLSVKALVPFPQMLDMMVKESDWTQKLGEAFLAQQANVIDSIQKLRKTANAAGSLKSTPEQTVDVKGESVEIESTDPEVVNVPSYDPEVVYGAWWWPDYPPYVIIPFVFAAAVAVGPFWSWGWGYWDWGRRDIDMNMDRTVNINSRHLHMTRGSLKTASFHQLAASRGAGISRKAGKLGAGHTGAGGRPSAASLRRQLSTGHTGLSKGGASSRDRDVRDRDLARRGSNMSHGRGFAHGAGGGGGMRSGGGHAGGGRQR